MSELQPETYTRKDMERILQYGPDKVREIWNAILEELPKKERNKWKTRMPVHYVNKYLGKE